MKKHRIFLTTLLLGMMMAFPLYCSADDKKVVISQDNYSTTSEFEAAINEAMNKYDNFSIEYSDNMENPTPEDSDTVLFAAPDSASGSVSTYSAADTVLYKIKDIKNLKNTFGKDYMSTSGSPGITIGLSREEEKDYFAQVEATFKCPKEIILKATWGSSKKVTLTYQGTWKVPSKVNGKKVKRGYLHMRPEYKVKQYSVYHKNYGTKRWVKNGTSKTKRASVVNIYKTYVYKK